MRNRLEWRTGRVQSAERIADDIRLIEFAVDGPVPRFDPGSHCNFRVRLEGGSAVRSYSCLPGAAGLLRVAVKRHEHSRGGSRYMWGLEPGNSIELTLPENRFELGWRAPHYLLIAGGIGITPIYGMARVVAGRGATVRLAYGARTRSAMAFTHELEALLGDRLELFATDEGRRIDIAAEIAALPPEGELNVCGPIPMLNAVKAEWHAAGRAIGRLRYEVFGDSGAFSEAPFQVEIPGLAAAIDVPPDQTLLDALLAAGVDMIHDCKRGECGLCVVKVIEHEGPIDHRDVFFSETDKQEWRRMCACVSRFAHGRAVIDVGYRP